MNAFLLDLRYSARILRKSPVFLAVSVLTLVLGIAATTAMFGIVNSLLLRLPFSNPDRLVRFTTQSPLHSIPGEVSYLDVRDWRRSNETFEGIAGIGSMNWSFVLEGDDPISLGYAAVSANFFDVLGSRPLLGRTFAPGDEPAGAAQVVVLSHDVWRARFGGDPSIVGRSIRLSGSSFTVIGVMPPNFRYPSGAMLWTPVAGRIAEAGKARGDDLLAERFLGILHAVGRLKAGVLPARAESDLASRMVRGDLRKNDRVVLMPLVDSHFGRVRSTLLIALASVGLLLTIACFNVAGLFLARSVRRRQEWAVRGAIGGTAGDLARLSIIEASYVALIATGGGLVAAPAVVNAIVSLDPTGLLAGYPIETDVRVLAFAISISLTTLGLASVGPTLHAMRSGATESISLRLRHRPSMARLRRWLVIAQFSLASLIVVAAGLMIRTVINVGRIDLGFDPDKLLVASGAQRTDLSRERRDANVDALMDAVRSVQGVDGVAGVYRAPLQGPIGLDGYVLVEGDPVSPESRNRHPPVNNEGVTTDYFATMRIPIVAGRPFTPSDRSDPSVVIVSRSLAALLWPGQNAVGQRMLTSFSLRPLRSDAGAVQWQTVVGVAADVRYREIERARFDVYLPVAQADAPVNDLVIRMRENSPGTIPAVRETIRRLEPGLPVRLRTMSSMVDSVTATWRMFLVIIGAFAAFAMVLTATGLYGLLTYLVQERTYEIGVRMALGAAPAQIRRVIVGGAAGLMSCGIFVGLCASVVVGRVMRSLVFEVSPADPVTVLGAACILMTIGLLATLLPSIQAMRVDPTRAFRAE